MDLLRRRCQWLSWVDARGIVVNHPHGTKALNFGQGLLQLRMVGQVRLKCDDCDMTTGLLRRCLDVRLLVLQTI